MVYNFKWKLFNYKTELVGLLAVNLHFKLVVSLALTTLALPDTPWQTAQSAGAGVLPTCKIFQPRCGPVGSFT